MIDASTVEPEDQKPLVEGRGPSPERIRRAIAELERGAITVRFNLGLEDGVNKPDFRWDGCTTTPIEGTEAFAIIWPHDNTIVAVSVFADYAEIVSRASQIRDPRSSKFDDPK